MLISTVRISMSMLTPLRINYFNNLHKNLKPISEIEKQKAIDILNKSVNLSNYQIKVGNVYAPGKGDFVQIELIKGDLKKYYLVDLKAGKIMKR